ncbi:MAG: 30S ribosomal protein S4e [Euryarchaeota archaeon]|nr:30S ribosomal protein S4e [Euryarchaeota archaeon]MDE1835727.1 30S ribosomal protein S4e [Euryarchaeota archaeon]MDE1880848.1 30S ribosomal protein S4e [Euryarchaeota archaeon]MDE2043918.1 30S ribosomal protein S4e [Thermoplasmata archaeon]
MPFRLKRRASPRSWPIARKGRKWVQRPSPGPHGQNDSMPLVMVLRDILHLANTAREARILLREGKVRVDGKVVKDVARGIGLMDVVSIAAPLAKDYRMLRDRRGRLTLLPIPPPDAKFKLGRVRFKHTVAGGKIALTLHDGRNLLVGAPTEIKVGDTLRVELPGQKVLQRIALGSNALAFISGGSHVGELARVDKVEVIPSSQPNRVHFKEGFSTVKDYVFIVGTETALVTLPGGLSP